MRRTVMSSSVRTAWLVSAALMAIAAAAFIPNSDAGTRAVQEPKDFDALDGHGPSGKKVDVIEWEGNLEIHVYPKGALKSLGMKVDRESKKTKNAVMVIEYGFNGVPYTMIRRAVLSINMPDFFHAFRDETADDYDKIIISGHLISGAKAYALQPPPTQLYPDYYSDGPSTDTAADANPAGAPAKTYRRTTSESPDKPGASDSPRIQLRSTDEVNQDGKGTGRKRLKQPESTDEDGAIRNFAF